MTEMKIDCPACKTPLIVGEHSIKIDRQQIQMDRFHKLEAAAKALVSYLYPNKIENPEMRRLVEDVEHLTTKAFGEE